MLKVNQLREEVEALVAHSYTKLASLVGGDFGPKFYNRPEVLAAEQRGLSVCDAVLGHVLRAAKDERIERVANELLFRVERSIVPREVVSQCHNLHAAVVGMLDQVGCPAIVVWGAVDARSQGTRGFCLSPFIKLAANHRPGHSWIVTPYHSVADISLAHQYGADDYRLLKSKIPTLIKAESRNMSEPELEWYRIENDSRFRLPRADFEYATKYHKLLGWTEYDRDGLLLRYLPGAVTLPKESELDDINIRIGGLRPGAFFKKNLSDLCLQAGVL